MSDEIKNPTRIEQYLSKAAGEDTDLPDAPMTRIEQYLAKIAGQDVELPDETYTRIEEYLKTIAENGGGGGGSATLISNKDISSNGTYKASDDSADGYKKVTVSVANTYAAGDEGKVVSSGQLVAQTAHATVTSNGTVDTTTNNSVEVAVPLPSGSVNINQNGTVDVTQYASVVVSVPGVDLSGKFAACILEDSGATARFYGANAKTPGYNQVTSIIIEDTVTKLDALAYNWGGSNVSLTGCANVEEITADSFRATGISGTVSLPKLKKLSGSAGGYFQGCTGLTNVTLGSVGHDLQTIDAGAAFWNCTQAGLTITFYAKGTNVDTLLGKLRNGATNATIVVKASEATTYGGNSFSAGDTILTSTP